MMENNGKIVLVTGAGRGIGKAIALAFAAEKNRVVITGRTTAVLEEVADEIRATGAEVLASTCDVSQKPQVKNLQHKIESHFGAVQILVNNVGIAPAADFFDMPDSLWDEVMRVNVTSAYNCCKAFLAAMVGASSGVTVNAVCPGYVNTELTRENAQRLAEKRGKSLDEALALMVASCPQRRLIEPEEVAYVTLMLASDRARGITGQAIQVDGGAVMA